MEIILISGIIIFVIYFNNKTEIQKFVFSSDSTVNFLRESNYDFYAVAKYGADIDTNILYSKRIKNCGIAFLFSIFIYIDSISIINILKVLGITFLVYKLPYFQLKSNYKAYMHKVDQTLPYYLKSLEILCQNYTVPVALSRSINDAPEIFKPGLKEMVSKIDAGDASIQPYMDFALKYPVKDSMRMMRLLYRLGLGAQENKHEQLLMFSKSVSSLQNKARELRYQSRLEWMEKRTLVMLLVTGGGMLVVLMFAMLFMM